MVEEEESEFSHFEDNEEFVGYNDDKVWLQTQFYSVDSSQSRIGVKSASSTNAHNQGLRQLFLTETWDLPI